MFPSCTEKYLDRLTFFPWAEIPNIHFTEISFTGIGGKPYVEQGPLRENTLELWLQQVYTAESKYLMT